MEQIVRYLPNEEHVDDLDCMLTWLTAHGGHPPSLKVKNCIKIMEQIMNDNLLEQIEAWYYNHTRTIYLNQIDQIRELKHVMYLEKQLLYPLRFLPNIVRLKPYNKLLFALRHYIIDQIPQMIDKCKEKIVHYLTEGDFVSCQEFINWIDEANIKNLDTKNEVLQFLINLLKMKYAKDINSNWQQKHMINDIYKQFISNDWPEFAKLLNVSSTDSRLNKVLFQMIESQFIKLRTDNIFDLVVYKYPDSEPTLLELKNVIKLDNQYKSLLTKFLYQFQDNLLNPSITTVEILIGFIKGLKSFLIIDPTGNYANKITTFIKLNLNDRDDLIDIILYSILGINEELLQQELLKDNIVGLNKLIYELQEHDEFYINYEKFLQVNEITEENIEYYNKFNQLHKRITEMNKRLDGEEDLLKRRHIRYSEREKQEAEVSPFVYEELINQYLTWVPQVNSNTMNINNATMNKDFENKIKFKHELIDYILSIVDDKSQLIKRLLELITRKLLISASYKLGLSWSICFKELYEKIRIERIDLTDHDNDAYHDPVPDRNDVALKKKTIPHISTENGSNLPIVTDDDDVTLNFNKINIMLDELKSSEEITTHYNNRLNDTDIKNLPKFISSCYWNLPKFVSTYDIKKDQRWQFKIDEMLEREILRATLNYQYYTKERRVLKYHKDQTRFAIELTLRNDQKKKYTLNISQYCVIEKFIDDKKRLTAEQLCELCGMTREDVQRELQWWVQEGVLRNEGGLYGVDE